MSLACKQHCVACVGGIEGCGNRLPMVNDQLEVISNLRVFLQRASGDLVENLLGIFLVAVFIGQEREIG